MAELIRLDKTLRANRQKGDVAGQRRRHKQREIKRRNVIAVDGEGVTDPDGSHRYTLLAASTGEYIAGHSLKTNDCLEFLTGLDSDSLIIAFSFGYDITKICRQLPRRALERLRDGEMVSNGRYQIRWIPGRTFWVRDVVRQRSITVYDVFGFFQSRFVVALQQWGIASPDELKFISDMKDLRGSFADADARRVRQYCLEECRTLVELFNRLRAAVHGADLYPSHWYGAGALAGAMLKKYQVPAFYPDEAPAYERHAYFGGRFELTGSGVFAPVHSYDIRSAYPAAMQHLPCLACGRERRVTAFDPMEWGIWRVSWNVPTTWSWAPFPFRAGSHIWWPANGQGWYHTLEVAAAVRIYGSRVTVHEGYIQELACDHEPFGFIPAMYDYRAILKASGDRAEYAIKLALNSLYGKMAQGKGWRGTVPPYRNYWYAGAVTAGCRAQLMYATHQNPDAVFSSATDGILSREPLDLDIGTNLGQWEYEQWDEAFCVQPGIYELVRNTVRKTKARGTMPREIHWDILRDMYNDSPLHQKYDFSAIRFFGIAASLQRTDYKQFLGKWIEMRRSITFDPKRRQVRVRDDGSVYFDLSTAPHDGLSEPFVALDDPAEDMDEWATLALEQP